MPCVETTRMDSLSRYRLCGVQEVSSQLEVGPSLLEVDYLGLRCLALRLRCRGGEKDESALVRRMADVCSTLSNLRHPHLVQFLGVSHDATSPRVPLLVTEYLPLSLASCINRYGVLPDEISYGILRDVALALHYLHEQTPPVIHGDLSAARVLIARDFTAKISGVGVARLVDPLGSRRERKPTPWHLPPEVCNEDARFSRKVDVFSFGILMLHTFCGRPPLPKAPYNSQDSEEEECSFLFLSQADLRMEYLNQLRFNHPMMETILNCIRNQPGLRPEIREMAPRLSSHASCQVPEFSTHMDILQRLQCQKEAQKKKFQRFSSQAMPEASSSTLEKVEELQQKVRRLSVQNTSLKMSLMSKNGFKNNNQMMSKPLEQVLTPDQVRLKWERCAGLPVGMFRAQATIIANNVYIGGGLTEDEDNDFCVFEYSIEKDSWQTLPPLSVRLFGLGQLMEELLVVGGKVDHQNISDRTYIFDRYMQLWRETAASLNIARFSPSILECDSAIIVAGGVGKKGARELGIISSIEVLNPDIFEWTHTGDLPAPACMSFSSPAVVGGTIYLLGGYMAQTAISASSHAHCSCPSSIFSASGMKLNLWQRLPDVPYLQTTAVGLGGCLLTLGGSEKPYSEPVNQKIHVYDATTESWVGAGHLPYACCHCAAVALPSGELLLMGGWVRPGEKRASRDVFKGVL